MFWSCSNGKRMQFWISIQPYLLNNNSHFTKRFKFIAQWQYYYYLAKMHLLRYLLITGQLYHWSRCTVSQTSIQGLNHKPFQWISEWWFKVTSLCSIIWHSIDLSFGWAIYYITSKYTAVIVVLVIIRVSNLSRWPCFGMAGNLIKMLFFFFFCQHAW